MKRKIPRIICYIILAIVFLFGALVFSYPLINRGATTHDKTIVLDNFKAEQEKAIEQRKESVSNPSESNGNNTTNDENVVLTGNFEQLYIDMLNYNRKIYNDNQSGLKDAWSYEQATFDLSAYGIFENVIAELRIPKMKLDEPVYLGATWDNMGKGVAQLGQTSMPIGGNNTNCVIAGHRGCSSGEFFLYIQNLEIGDKVYIDNFWGTLNYKVSKIDIISPDDIDKILIQKDKDMLTLITCHPYPYNYQRYAVYCERTTDSENSANTNSNSNSNEISTDNIPEATATTQDSDISITTENTGTSQLFIIIDKVSLIAIPILLIILALALNIRRKK